MPQITVLKNLVKFVSLTEKKFKKSLTAKLAETKDPAARDKIERQLKKHQNEFPIFLKKLKIQFEEGMCFGFSVCHGIMQDAHQLEWWESALQLIADWHGESLDETIFWM